MYILISLRIFVLLLWVFDNVIWVHMYYDHIDHITVSSSHFVDVLLAITSFHIDMHSMTNELFVTIIIWTRIESYDWTIGNLLATTHM